MAFITINYDEGNKENLNYQSVEISYSGNQKRIFNSGNFVKDWFDCKKFFDTETNDEYLTQSSTIDHFIMDGAPYDSAYLKIVDKKPYLDYAYDYFGHDNGREFFVPKGTQPTWEELKKMCEI